MTNVASPEAVDCLLDVSDEEALRPLRAAVTAAGQEAEQLYLGRVNVLKLIHHKVPEPRPVGSGDVRVRTQQADRHDFQVKVVQGRQLSLVGLVPGAGVLEEAMQRGNGLKGKLVVLVPGRKLSEFLANIPEPAHCYL